MPFVEVGGMKHDHVGRDAVVEPSTVDELLQPLGVWSVWHASIYIACLLQAIAGAMRVMLAVYTHVDIDVQCNLPLSDALLKEEQERGGQITSIALQWALVCDDAWLLGLAGSVFFIGWFAGAGVFGWMSDRYGRRKSMWTATFIMFCGTVGSAVAPVFWVYIAFNTMSGFGAGGTLMLSYVLTVEWVTSEHRALVGVIVSIFFPIGSLLLVPLAFLVQSWRPLTLAVAFFCVVCLPFHGWMPESPHWLVSQGREEEALLTIRTAYKINGQILHEDNYLGKADELEARAKDTDEDMDNEDNLKDGDDGLRTEEDIEEPQVQQTESGTWTLLTHPAIRVRAWAVCLLWFTSSFVYYGLTMSSSTIGSNLYFSMCLSGITELIATAGTYLLTLCVGRKLLVVMGLVIVSVCCFMVPVIGQIEALSVLFAVIGRSTIASVFVVIYIYTAELFPTSLRGSAMGFSSQASRVGGTIAPYVGIIASSGGSGKAIAMSLFGGMSLVCAIFSLLLPETAGTQFDLNLTSMVKRLYEIDYNPVTRTAPRQDVEGYQPLTRNSTDDMSFDL